MPSSRIFTDRARRLLAVLEPLSIAALLELLLWKTWFRWSDPLTDFPRDLYIAWRLSEGDVLYQKIANWYGPLANLVQGAGFHIFGTGYDTMVAMNFVLLVACLLLLRGIFGAIGNRLSVWLGSIVFLVFFAFGHLTQFANYNYLTPYVAQATYSFLGLLIVLWGLLKHLQTERGRWLAVAGFGFAVAYLDKPEGVLAALGALAIYIVAHTVRAARENGRGWRWLAQALGWLAGGFLTLWLPVLIYFWTKGGFAFAFRAANYVPVTLMDPMIRQQIASSQLLQAVTGLDNPSANFRTHLEAGLELVVVCGVIAFAGDCWTQTKRFRFAWWAWAVVATAVAALGGYLGNYNDGWLTTGPAFSFPVMFAAAFCLAWSLRAAWRGSADFARALGLAVVGAGAALMLSRMVLNARLGHYGFVMMPLAVLFWIHLAVVEIARARQHPAALRTNWLAPVAIAAVVLYAAGTVLVWEIGYYGRKTFAVGEGRDRFYTFPPLHTKSGYVGSLDGLLLNTLLSAFRLKAPKAQTLAAFPEGIAANYHLRIPTPLAELEFQPVALGYVGPDHVLAELQDNPPDAVLIYYRNYNEYGDRYFGADDASGRRLLLWVQDHYVLAGKAGRSAGTDSQHAVDIYVRRPPANAPPLTITPF